MLPTSVDSEHMFSACQNKRLVKHPDVHKDIYWKHDNVNTISNNVVMLRKTFKAE